MFDQPQNQSTEPPKAEDIFESVDTGTPRPPALSAGVPQIETKIGIRPQPFIIGGVVLLIIVLLGFGFWFLFFRKAPATIINTVPINESVQNTATPTSSTVTTQPETPVEVPEPTPTPPLPPADTDGDGFIDMREAELGTNINSPDTDGDGLFDREEVEVYLTNPLNPDTDGDGHGDGTEVRNGYNPNGAGRLFQIPQ